ncbi:MAG: glycosyltransferase family 4 protein [Armatimonadetes bacterium]|nr:glycosyltransferase family 4 protein [Armatimonadota bacterium]
MRIGYDARPIVLFRTGMRTYSVNLIRELAESEHDFEALLYFCEGNPDSALIGIEKVKWRKVSAPFGWWWTIFQLPAVVGKDRVAIFHAEYSVPPLVSCPTIVTVHDAISAMFLEPADLKTRVITNAFTLLAVHRSRFVLTPSESAKRDVAQRFFVPKGKIVVTPYGVSGNFKPVPKGKAKRQISERFGIEGRFVLTVNFSRPRKNAHILAKAFRELVARKVPVNWLVFAGVCPESVKKLILKMAGDASERVIFTGFVHDDDLPVLYSAADVFAFPSRYEGFGLPVLEAMACGTPVVAGDAPAVNEFAKPAAILVPPNDWKSLAEAIEQVLVNENLAESLRQKGLKLASNYTWARTASLTWQVYQKTISNP